MATTCGDDYCVDFNSRDDHCFRISTIVLSFGAGVLDVCGIGDKMSCRSAFLRRLNVCIQLNFEETTNVT